MWQQKYIFVHSDFISPEFTPLQSSRLSYGRKWEHSVVHAYSILSRRVTSKTDYWHRGMQLFLQCFHSLFEVCLGLAGSFWWSFGNQLSNKLHDSTIYLLPKFVSLWTEGFKFVHHSFTVLAGMQQAGCSENLYFFVHLSNGLSENFVSGLFLTCCQGTVEPH